MKGAVNMTRLWIDAVGFAHYGEWRVETQFVREMGQGYLIAINLPGEPVKDAHTPFSVIESGMYRIWVRTKNWLKEHSPGRFVAMVDGARVGNELGTLPNDNWTWQLAGDTELTPGEHDLAIRDTTGYFPRFAAVLITDDMDYVPSPEWPRIRRERARLLGLPDTIERYAPFDVVVCGAGPGGIPAAISAARAGMKVALIHSRPVLGGNASSEATVGFDGAYISHPGMREGGIAEEIRRVRDSKGTTWHLSLEELCRAEPNLHIFLNQCVIDAETDNDRVTAAITQDTLTGARAAFEGRVFIDATGDGWLGYYAGAAYRVGREAHWQHGEGHAPRTADQRTMSGCLMGSTDTAPHAVSYYATDTGIPQPFCAPGWAQILPERLFRTPNRLHTGEWWLENPTDYDDLFEAEMTRDRLIVISLAYFHWLKNHYERRDLVKNYKISYLPLYNAKRENRRLIGDYVLTQEDCTSGRHFDDVISYAGWTIDLHNQQGIFSGPEGPYDFDLQVPINQIPYRCVYSKNIKNLMMAGRCLSVSHIALGTVRVENTLAALGQAAGAAAAMAINLNITPREIGTKHIKALQQRLLRDDLYIPGIANEDPADTARFAKITATSHSVSERFDLKRGLLRAIVPLSEAIIMVFRRKIESDIRLYLQNAGGDTSLSYQWVSFVGATDMQDILESRDIPVSRGFEGFVEIPLPGMDDARACSLKLLPNAALSVQRVEFADHPFFLATYRAPYWRFEQNATLRHYLSDDPQEPIADCTPASVASGVSRPLSEDNYGWVSDPAQPLPQQIDLTYKTPIDVAMIQITFDTDLKNPLYSYQSLPVVRELVKDYDVLTDNSVAVEVRGNQHRLNRHYINARDVKTVSVRVLSTWGDPSARIFEIRTYERA